MHVRPLFAICVLTVTGGVAGCATSSAPATAQSDVQVRKPVAATQCRAETNTGSRLQKSVVCTKTTQQQRDDNERALGAARSSMPSGGAATNRANSRN